MPAIYAATAAALRKRDDDSDNSFSDNPKSEKSIDSLSVQDYIFADYVLCCMTRDQLDRLNHTREVVGNFLAHQYFTFFIISLISINAIFIGVATFDFVTQDKEVEGIFEGIDLAFLIIFTVELGFQIFVHGFRLLKDGWLVFDLIVIVLSWSFADFQIIRAFRIFRALRLITRIKSMRELVSSIVSTAPKMVAIGFLLFIIFFIFSIMFTEMFGELTSTDEYGAEYNYFGRMDITSFTLFQFMTMDGWADIARFTMDIYWWAWIPLLSFIIISGFIVVNLIIAVICESMVDDDDEEESKGSKSQQSKRNSKENEVEINGKVVEFQKEISQDDIASQESKLGDRKLQALENQVNSLMEQQNQTLQNLQSLLKRLRS